MVELAKWLPICVLGCLGTILGLAPGGLTFGYSYPARFPKRAPLPAPPPGAETDHTHSKSFSKLSERWEQHAPKLGLDDAANPAHAASAERTPHEAELLEEVDVMQFFKGRKTSHKRSWPIPQLLCTNGCDEGYEPSMVQCTNAKSAHEEVTKWRCEADLPGHLKFQKTLINCEGFESVEDNRILRGSCGLEYSLTKSGWKPNPGRVHGHYYGVADENMAGWTASWFVVIGVIIYLRKAFVAPVAEREGLRAKVATAHQAWKKELAPSTQSN